MLEAVGNTRFSATAVVIADERYPVALESDRRIVPGAHLVADVDPVDDLVLRVPQHPFTDESPLLDDLFGYALFVHV